MSSPYPLVPDAALEDLSARGQAIYEAQLKSRLEPEHDRRFVAVHVDSGEYAVARSSAEAVRALRRLRPGDGRLYVRRIGSEPEYGLAARILQSDMIAAQQK